MPLNSQTEYYRYVWIYDAKGFQSRCCSTVHTLAKYLSPVSTINYISFSTLYKYQFNWLWVLAHLSTVEAACSWNTLHCNNVLSRCVLRCCKITLGPLQCSTKLSGSVVSLTLWRLWRGHWRSALSRQSSRMSKITNDDLTRSGTGCFIAVPVWQHWALKG